MRKIIALLFIILGFIMVGCNNNNETIKEDLNGQNENVNDNNDINYSNTLIINYYRFSADYEDWDLWIWQHLPSSLDGNGYKFDIVNKTNSGIKARIDLSTSNFEKATKLGFIVRRGGNSWTEKDIEEDRYIDLTKLDSKGNINVYLVQGDSKIGYSENDPNGPKIEQKIMNSTFIDDKTILFTSTVQVDEGSIKIISSDTDLDIRNITNDNNSYTITLLDSINISLKYKIIVSFSGKETSTIIGLEGLYDTKLFIDEFTYNGELGAIYSSGSTTFRVWSPIASSIMLSIYEDGSITKNSNGDKVESDQPIQQLTMSKLDKGVYETVVIGDLHGKYYTYTVLNGESKKEIVDPYAKSTGVNGQRGMIVDFSRLNPEGWEYNSRPNTVKSNVDQILYELHVRDLTSHVSWNGTESNRGKFLGLVEEGTTYDGYTTGLDHIKELGVTTVHLLPIQDAGLNDESGSDKFNWGYMTENYNTLEGSYSSNPYDGGVRVNEFKKVVQGFHKNNLRIVMDVVYNHTFDSAKSNFNVLMPGYYYRMKSNGTFSNGSGCGNETASERTMFSKFMIDSILFYAKEYNVDGFRFDLMGLHDIKTINKISKELKKIDSSIIIYGEPWTAGGESILHEDSANKDNISNMPDVAIFNDEIRDGIKGSVFTTTEGGYVQGNLSKRDNVIRGILGNGCPLQSINYVSAHDNNTLHDKLVLTGLSGDILTNAIKQSNAIVLTSQGIPFLHAGVEMERTKHNGVGYDGNSYQSPDSVNQLRWDLKGQKINTFNYYKGLIELRNQHSAFRIDNSTVIADNISFINSGSKNVIGYTINGASVGDSWKNIAVIFNSSKNAESVTLPAGSWVMVVNKDEVNLSGIKTLSGKVSIKSGESLIFYMN